VTADPRLLARFDAGVGRWRIAEGIYRVALGKSVTDLCVDGCYAFDFTTVWKLMFVGRDCPKQ
jgi:hypothetical protein